MKKTYALIIAAVIGLTAGADAAYARGDGGQESQAKLQKQLAEQRARSSESCPDASVWEMIFGHEEAVATGGTVPTVSK